MSVCTNLFAYDCMGWHSNRRNESHELPFRCEARDACGTEAHTPVGQSEPVVNYQLKGQFGPGPLNPAQQEALDMWEFLGSVALLKLLHGRSFGVGGGSRIQNLLGPESVCFWLPSACSPWSRRRLLNNETD